MKKLAPAILLLAFLASCAHLPSPGIRVGSETGPGLQAAHPEGGIRWEPWSDEAFARAKKERKLVVLDLQAVWCHWCHVMEATTYQDAEVIRLLGEHYVALQVDQDSRPDLANRYENYGWPATIFFGSDGQELVKRAGYIEPQEMRSLLARLIANPVAEAGVGPDAQPRFPVMPSLAREAREKQEKAVLATFDFKKGGWKTGHRLLDAYLIDYALLKARTGDSKGRTMARKTLDSQRKILDPAWGGMYQYSVGNDWNEPHFEKIMSVQTDNILAYTNAYLQWRDPRDLKTAREVYRFIADFLTAPGGVFYTSQDADLKQGEHAGDFFLLSDSQRRKRGIPRVDQHVYARENGWVIESLMGLYAATGEEAFLERARGAAQGIERLRRLPGGGFKHGEQDTAGHYLGDTLAMARAYLALYAGTAEREWLKKASEGADFMDLKFRATPGYSTLARSGDQLGIPETDENIQLARFANQLFHYTGKAAYKEMAQRAMLYLGAPEVHDRIWSRAGVLMADHELGRDPVHLTIVGPKADAQAQALFKSALPFPSTYRRIEWLDEREGALPHADIEYPKLSRPAAFACGEGRCSRPAYTPAELQDRVRSLAAPTR